MLCLARETDPAWVDVALADISGVLADHAHCEMKAATTALSLASRYPSFSDVVHAMVSLAEEELSHFRMVLAQVEKRGSVLRRPPPDEYASELRKLAFSTARDTSPRGQLVDRLLVGAIIEARSCERFRLLAGALAKSGETELSTFYDDLLAAEARHYRTFVDLAISVGGDEDAVRDRLSKLAEAEGLLISRLGVSPTVHG